MPDLPPLLVPAIRLDRDDGTEEARALERAAAPWCAGFLLFGGEAGQVAALVARLREAAGRPIFVAADMERGAGQQVQGLTRLPDAGLVGLAGRPWDAWKLGELTALEARSVGLDVVFAPCADVRSTLDNPILGNRSFGFEPHRVAELAAATSAGIQGGGCLPVVKHFPGHGATTEDSHEAVPVVHASEAVLADRDLTPFAKVIGWTECPGVMTAHVAYPALDASGAIATFSAPIVARARALMHPDTGRGLCVFTDALLMAGAAVPGGEPEAARRALAAGCDALLYPEDPEAVAAALAREADPAHLERAGANVARFAALAARARPEPLGDPEEDGAALARDLAERALAMASDVAPLPDPASVLVLDDDDIEERGAVLAAACARHGVPCAVVRVPRGEGPARLPAPAAPTDAHPLHAIVVFASARAWKGCAGTSEACRRACEQARSRAEADGALVSVVWLAPRAGPWHDVHLPGTGPQVEAALAARLFPEEGGSHEEAP